MASHVKSDFCENSTKNIKKNCEKSGKAKVALAFQANMLVTRLAGD